MTLAKTLGEIQLRLQRNPKIKKHDLARVESEQIIERAFELNGTPISRTELLMSLRQDVVAPVVSVAMKMADQRALGFPLQHITGKQRFLDHDYWVNDQVLVPRPETELLVEVATEHLDRPTLGAEIGLGSGVISVELASRFPDLKMLATEVSREAIGVAQRNIESILGEQQKQIEVIKQNDVKVVLDGLAGKKLDFLISNPPYLLFDDEIDDEVVEHEPSVALFSPDNIRIFFYQKIADGARAILKENGKVFLEVPHERAVLIQQYFSSKMWSTKLLKDLAGKERVLVAWIK